MLSRPIVDSTATPCQITVVGVARMAVAAAAGLLVPLPAVAQGAGKHLEDVPQLQPLLEWRLEVVLATALAMVAATMLAIPIALVYRRVRSPREFDPSVLQSIMILPATVAGIVSVVRGSLALAFSLAGVTAAVRFRNSLKDTHDAVYIFLAVALGLAAGDQELDIAVVLTVVFSATMLLLRKTRFDGALWNGDGHGHRNSNHHGKSGHGRSAGNGEALEPDQAGNVELVAVHAEHPDAARPIVEALLADRAKEWHLAQVLPGSHGDSTLEYVVRFKKKTALQSAIEAINARGTHDGIVAEVRRAPDAGSA